MGGTISTLYSYKSALQTKLFDKKCELTRVLSKSNSMEAIDKVKVSFIKDSIKHTESELDMVNRAIEDEHALSF